jgi:ribosomal protein S18 acetylase RimI-like enzyme
MVEIECRTLDTSTLEDVHSAFCEAFSDYVVQMDMPLWKFEMTARRRGYDPRISMGAFAGDRLVGFIINGLRQWDGRPTAYDTGTGVVPDFRKRGITTRMFGNLVDLLRDEGVEAYLLEVIKGNDPARELYLKQGFRIVREFSCHKGRRDGLGTGPGSGMVLDHITVEELDWERLSSMWDFVPSWQNSIESVMAVPETLLAVTARTDGDLAGYGLVEPRSGDVPQLAVAPERRGRGVGRAIMGELARLAGAEWLVVLNIEEGSGPMGDFVNALGMELFTDQYEMVLEL